MLDIIKNNKFTVGLIVVLIVGAFLYQVYVVGDVGSGESEGAAAANEAVRVQVGANVYRLVGQINNIEIDQSVLTRPDYARLRNFGYDPLEVKDRNANPFAPIGASSGSDVEPSGSGR